MATTHNRLLAEICEAEKNKSKNIKFVVDQDNFYSWTAYLKGPPDTPYETGTFVLHILCPNTFPINPPSVICKTPIFHPNINAVTGEICADILKKAWSPVWTISYLCHAIISLLADPNHESPLNCDAGNLLRHGDIRAYNSVARMYTAEYASEPIPDSDDEA